MYVKKQNGKIYGATLTATEKKALDLEIQRVLAETYKEHEKDVDVAILYTLYNHFGWGVKRLKDFYNAFSEEYENLINHYQMPDAYPWLCNEMLLRIGVNVEEWSKESEVNNNGKSENGGQ